jgi:predicted DNA-binding transcriptional regulator AlpA
MSAFVRNPADVSVETIVPELLTVSEAAKLLNIGTRSLWRWSRCGIAPPPVRIGNAVRYRRGEYLDWIASGCKRIDWRVGK